MSWNCEYTKTLSGTCDQQKSPGGKYCFYHTKVDKGYITDVDEQAVIRDMPTIKL